MFAAAAAASTVLARYPTTGNNNNSGSTPTNTPSVTVHVLESSSRLLKKVKISGGGRCNLLHDTSRPIPELLEGYPRGRKELNGILNQYFGPKDAERWFTDRGVIMKTEGDGRMFPVTDSSQTVIDCIVDDADRNGVERVMHNKVVSIERMGNRFIVGTVDRNDKSSVQNETYDAIVLATGSFPPGHALAASLGHSITKCVPSLFTLNTRHHVQERKLLHNLSGVSLKNARLTLKIDQQTQIKTAHKHTKTVVQEGPLLITHNGISGPAALRLSAFAARHFHSMNYRAKITIHWAPDSGSVADIESILRRTAIISPKRCVSTSCPLPLSVSGSKEGMRSLPSSAIPRRLWAALVQEAGLEKDTTWCETPKHKIRSLARTIAECGIEVTSKNVYKEEFVTAGGVSLKEIVMKRMESKICDGLFFCGEVCDVDGVTGGFNFLNCWSTGYVAGKNAAERVMGIVVEQEAN